MELVDAMTLLMVEFYKDRGLLILGISGQSGDVQVNDLTNFVKPLFNCHMMNISDALFYDQNQDFRTIRVKVMSTFMFRCNAKLSKNLLSRFLQGPILLFCMIFVDTMSLLKIKFDQNRGLFFLGISGQKSRSTTFTIFFLNPT